MGLHIVTSRRWYSAYYLGAEFIRKGHKIHFINPVACVYILLMQVYTQPLFAFFEKIVSRKWPRSTFIHKEYYLTKSLHVNLFRLVWRTIYVILTTVVSMTLPFFNDVMGLIGAFAFWPLTVYFPISMFIVQQKIQRWSRKWVLLQIVSVLCFVVSLAAAMGSIEGMIVDLRTYKPFKS